VGPSPFFFCPSSSGSELQGYIKSVAESLRGLHGAAAHRRLAHLGISGGTGSMITADWVLSLPLTATHLVVIRSFICWAGRL
jgi:hypothetical protein